MVDCYPPSVAHKPACLHLPGANRYFGVEFLDWTGNGGGGGMAYLRKAYVKE